MSTGRLQRPDVGVTILDALAPDVVAEAIVFVPMLFVAEYYAPGAIGSAATFYGSSPVFASGVCVILFRQHCYRALLTLTF